MLFRSDILTNEIPSYFRHGALYTTAAFVGAATFVALRGFGDGIAVPASIALAVGLRIYSVWRGASLPRPHWMRTGAHAVPPDHPAKPPVRD